jgi:hypothetical protein
MRRIVAILLVLLPACAAHQLEEREDAPCCVQPPPAPEDVPVVGLLNEAERCEAAARILLTTNHENGWRALAGCVANGRFTALRALLRGDWDHDLQTRSDAPLLIARIIAERGGNVDDDLPLLHEHRVPLFSLRQALARPELYQGALVIVRARLSSHGVVDETRLVSQMRNVQVGLTDRVVTRAAAPYGMDSRHVRTVPRAYNLDIPTGNRMLAAMPPDPFVDEGDSLVLLARFDGLRAEDQWPVLTVMAHLRPNAALSY